MHYCMIGLRSNKPGNKPGYNLNEGEGYNLTLSSGQEERRHE